MLKRVKVFSLVIILAVLSFAVVPVLGISATIQPSSQDSFINAGFTGLNYGDSTTILVRAQSSTEAYHGLVQFDLSFIPAGSTIISATLKLYYCNWGTNNPAGRTIAAYRLTQSWDEDSVTWNRYDGTNAWATAGGDYTTTNGASATVPGSFGWMGWSVTGIVTDWVSYGEYNKGFLLKDTNEESGACYITNFWSSEAGNSELQPVLEVEYRTVSSAIPEFPFGTAFGIAACFAALAAFLVYQRKQK